MIRILRRSRRHSPLQMGVKISCKLIRWRRQREACPHVRWDRADADGSGTAGTRGYGRFLKRRLSQLGAANPPFHATKMEAAALRDSRLLNNTLQVVHREGVVGLAFYRTAA